MTGMLFIRLLANLWVLQILTLVHTIGYGLVDKQRQTTSNVDDDVDDDDVHVIQIPGRATNPTLKKIS